MSRRRLLDRRLRSRYWPVLVLVLVGGASLGVIRWSHVTWRNSLSQTVAALDNAQRARLDLARIQSNLRQLIAAQGRRHDVVLGAWGAFLVAVALTVHAVSRARGRSEARYRLLSTLAPVGIFRCDETGRCDGVNDAWRRLTGRNDWAARPWFEAVRAEDRDGVLERWRGLVAQGAPFAHEFRLNGPGADVWVLGLCRGVMGPDGARAGFVGTLTDVTERRTIEAQLRHAQKMEAVGQMTSGIAHDFRNILTVVEATAESVERTLPVSADDELRGELDELRLAVRRGADITGKLLAFGRMDHLAVAPLDLREAVAEGVPMLRRLVPEGVEIVADVPDEAVVAQADLNAVTHILANLTANARDAMPGGGTVRIGVGHVRHEGGAGPALPPGEYVLVTVGDTGTGMDDATRARIFDPFFTTKPPGAGTGLGMPMVLRLVEAQGGAITVTSAPGAGTTVRLYFRTASRPEPAPAVAERAPIRGGDEMILLVEDDEALRRAEQRALERLGYQVLVAADGLEALEVLRRHAAEVKLVVSDSSMPRLTGRELYATIRREGMSVPFLFASGYGPGESPDGSVPEAEAPYLPKPWTLEDLADKVRQVLDRG